MVLADADALERLPEGHQRPLRHLLIPRKPPLHLLSPGILDSYSLDRVHLEDGIGMAFLLVTVTGEDEAVLESI